MRPCTTINTRARVHMQVRKAEGPRETYTDWWLHRGPAGMSLEQLQQLAASRLGAAAAAGVAQAYAAAGANSRQEPAVRAADGAGNSLGAATLQRWLLAEVGLAAQAQLQQLAPRTAGGAVPQQPVVHAAAAPGSYGPRLLSGGEQHTGGAPAAVGSKNQDPGIAVDARAIAYPGG